MKQKVMILVLSVYGLFLLWGPSVVSAGDIIIIANSSVPADTLDENTIKNIFLGDTFKWSNGNMINIVIAEKTEVHNIFLDKYIKRSESQFRNVWRQNMFTGKGKQPKRETSIEGLLEYISKTPDSIGYAYSDTILPKDVKILAR